VIEKATHCLCNFNKKTEHIFRHADKYIQEGDEIDFFFDNWPNFIYQFTNKKILKVPKSKPKIISN